MAQLPPKIPNQNWPPTIPPNQRMPPLTTTSPPPQQPPPPQPSPTAAASLWADEFLDFSSARRGHHRRSMSDSIAFLESPLIDACRNSLHAGAGGFDRLDDEQLMSMFSDDVSGGRDSNNGMVGSPSDQNSNNDENVMSAEYNDGHNGDGDGDGDGERSHWLPKTEVGEVESDCNNNNNNNSLSAPSSGNVTPIYSDADPTCFDPKRVKRILANRQSAQRSRVRKLQYISELERSVTSLQTEVSALSPRVAYLDHQRLILNVDNSAIKQRIAALAQDKIFKDAHQEALKKEIERLSQIYHHQQQHQQTMKLMGNTATQPPSSDHSMDCADKEQLMA